MGQLRSHITVTSPPCLCRCEGVAATLDRDQHSRALFSLWRALRTAKMDLHIPDNSLLSHSTCFLQFLQGMRVQHTPAKKCAFVEGAWCLLLSSVMLLISPPKNKDTSTETLFRVIVSVCPPLCPFMHVVSCPTPPSLLLSPGFGSQTRLCLKTQISRNGQILCACWKEDLKLCWCQIMWYCVEMVNVGLRFPAKSVDGGETWTWSCY